MAQGYTQEYNIPVLVVHAENFKTDDHLPGIEHTMEASIQLMEEQSLCERVNVLGLRLGDFSRTEVCRVLQENGIETGMLLPGKTSVEGIRTAPGARCNLVVHPIGLPLARKMKERFGTPYVLFERYTDPDRILASYRALFEALGLALLDSLKELHAETSRQTVQARETLAGGTYISGNTALCNYELHSFLAGKLGIKPLLLQISDLDEGSAAFRKDLLACCDPYVTRAANISALRYLYPVLKPDYNLGAGVGPELRKNGIAGVRMADAYHTLGFEVCSMVLDAFLRAKQEQQQLQEERP